MMFSIIGDNTKTSHTVIPAKAGIQLFVWLRVADKSAFMTLSPLRGPFPIAWIPAFA